MPRDWSIIVHGGAKKVRSSRRDANRRGCLSAVGAGRMVLAEGGSAVDAVVAAVRVLEDDPAFNAGYGCVVNAKGEAELDAAIMDGSDLALGGVGALVGVRNPIDVARAMLKDRASLLVGEGARAYAEELGVEFCDPVWLGSARTADEAEHDTVGCVAFDRHGNVAAGTSTGGLSGVRPGRIGDSPLPGCGLYAENGVGGVSLSGDGESIMRLALAARLMADLAALPAQAAADRAIALMPRVGGEAGCILLGGDGTPAFAHNSENFAVALAASNHDPAAFLHRGEWDG